MFENEDISLPYQNEFECLCMETVKLTHDVCYEFSDKPIYRKEKI